MATFTGFGKVLTKKFLYLLIGGVEICNFNSVSQISSQSEAILAHLGHVTSHKAVQVLAACPT